MADLRRHVYQFRTLTESTLNAAINASVTTISLQNGGDPLIASLQSGYGEYDDTLDNAITDLDGYIYYNDGTNDVGILPVVPARLSDGTNEELVHITAYHADNDDITVIRGAENTTAQSWLSGDKIELVDSAFALNDVMSSGISPLAHVLATSSPIDVAQNNLGPLTNTIRIHCETVTNTQCRLYSDQLGNSGAWVGRLIVTGDPFNTFQLVGSGGNELVWDSSKTENPLESGTGDFGQGDDVYIFDITSFTNELDFNQQGLDPVSIVTWWKAQVFGGA